MIDKNTQTLFLQEPNEDCDIYYSHWQSIIAGFQLAATEMKRKGLMGEDGLVLNFDDFVDIKDYPMVDCVILRSFACDSDDSGALRFSFNLGVSTYNDMNNHRLEKIISYLFGRYHSGRSQYILDEVGERKAVLTFTDDTVVNPMSKAELRSLQFITVVGLSSSTLS